MILATLPIIYECGADILTLPDSLWKLISITRPIALEGVTIRGEYIRVFVPSLEARQVPAYLLSFVSQTLSNQHPSHSLSQPNPRFENAF